MPQARTQGALLLRRAGAIIIAFALAAPAARADPMDDTFTICTNFRGGLPAMKAQAAKQGWRAMTFADWSANGGMVQEVQWLRRLGNDPEMGSVNPEALRNLETIFKEARQGTANYIKGKPPESELGDANRTLLVSPLSPSKMISVLFPGAHGSIASGDLFSDMIPTEFLATYTSQEFVFSPSTGFLVHEARG